MKKILIVFVVVTLLIGSSHMVTAYASDENTNQDQQTAVYDIPNSKYFNDIIGNYNFLGTLRMTFPDICFIQNQQAIEDVLNGKKEDFLVDDTAQAIRYNFAVKLYLLGPQLMVYCNEFYKLGVVNPYWERAIESANEQPTNGKIDLLKMLQQSYINMRILRLTMF